MNFSVSGLAAGLIFGTFGLYFIRQGKKDAQVPPIAIGLILLVYPYFVENLFLLWGVGAGLLVLGFRQVF